MSSVGTVHLQCKALRGWSSAPATPHQVPRWQGAQACWHAGNQQSSDQKTWLSRQGGRGPVWRKPALLLGFAQLHGACVHAHCGDLEGVSSTQPELYKTCPISKLEESPIFRQHTDSKNQPQRKVKRHIRETINTI